MAKKRNVSCDEENSLQKSLPKKAKSNERQSTSNSLQDLNSSNAFNELPRASGFSENNAQDEGEGTVDEDKQDSVNDIASNRIHKVQRKNVVRPLIKKKKSGKKKTIEQQARLARKEVDETVKKHPDLYQMKIQKEVHEMSTKWNCENWILSAYAEEMASGNLPTEMDSKLKTFFDEMEERNEEKNCKLVEVLPGHQFPDNGSRGLGKNIEDLVFQRSGDLPKVPANGLPTPNTQEGVPLPLKFTGKLCVRKETKGEEIVKAVSTNGVGNGVYEETKLSILMDCPNGLVKEEQEFFEKINGGEIMDNEEAGRCPVAEFDATKYSNDQLTSRILSTSICVITNVFEKFEIDKEQFCVEEIQRVEKREKIVKIRRQLPQPTTSNFYMFGNSSNTKEWSHQLQSFDYDEETTCEEFAEKYIKMKELAKRTLKELIENIDDAENIMAKFREELKLLEIPLYHKHKADKNSIILSFGTNFDLVDEKDTNKFQKQIESLDKLPEYLKFNGANNLLNYAGEIIPGVNMPQLYLKPPGAKTSPHIENHALGSLNINLGPGECVWFSIPLEYHQKFHSFLLKNFEKEEIEKKTYKEVKENIMYEKGFWPNEYEILEAGIPLMKFIQKPGAAVYVNYGTYHWVQANGYCSNIAWNIAQPTFTQLAMAGIVHDHFLAMKRTPIMAIEHIVWNMAMQNAKVDDKKLFDFVKVFLMRSLAHAQQQHQYINFKKYKIVPFDAEQNVYRCQGCSEILFNYVPFADNIKSQQKNKETKSTKEARKSPYCLKCCEKTTGITVYQTYSIDNLIEVYDNYTQS